MAPLIDVVFQLLIFFMLSSSFLTPSLRLDLPKAVSQDERKPEQIIVSVDQTGKIFLNTKAVSMEELKPSLMERLAKDSEKSIHLRGDQAMPYRFFVEVMDLARQAGARHIHIVHESKDVG